MDTDAFVNRELSWLEFNRRVLEEAQDPSVPLLERVKFLSIFSSNLDECFMVRVATLKRRIEAGDKSPRPDGLTPAETKAAMAARIHELVGEQHRCFLEEIQPLLAAEGIVLLRPKETSEEQQRFLEEYFRRTLLPVLTPLAVDPGHPFPYLGNRSLCLVASVRPSTPSALPHSALSVIHIPSQVLPRFVALPDPAGKHVFMLLEDVIRLHLPSIYNGYDILSSHAIRVTRDADPPAAGPSRGSARQHRGEPARAPPRHGRAPTARRRPAARHPGDAARRAGAVAGGPLRGGWLHGLLGSVPALRGRWTCRGSRTGRCRRIRSPRSSTRRISGARSGRGDVLVHHPYHTFDAVTRFVRDAAVDPKVLAIKMTLYRVSPASPIAHALRTAVENGKEVAVLVELQARFDEEANIRWARTLEKVGAHVVYGRAGFKTHCKACLVVRQETDGSGATAISPPATTTCGRAASTATSGSSRAATRSART